MSASWAPSEHVPEQETKQAAWPLKKGAWDRIQQGAKTVKPDRWHVNEAAGMVSDSAGLQASFQSKSHSSPDIHCPREQSSAFIDYT